MPTRYHKRLELFSKLDYFRMKQSKYSYIDEAELNVLLDDVTFRSKISIYLYFNNLLISSTGRFVEFRRIFTDSGESHSESEKILLEIVFPLSESHSLSHPSLSHSLSLVFSSLCSAPSIVEGERVRKMRKGVREREREGDSCAHL